MSPMDAFAHRICSTVLFISTYTSQSLHISLYRSYAQTLITKAKWLLQSKDEPLTTKKTIPSASRAHSLTSLLIPIILQLQETLLLQTQRLISFPKNNLFVYFSSLPFLFIQVMAGLGRIKAVLNNFQNFSLDARLFSPAYTPCENVVRFWVTSHV